MEVTKAREGGAFDPQQDTNEYIHELEKAGAQG